MKLGSIHPNVDLAVRARGGDRKVSVTDKLIGSKLKFLEGKQECHYRCFLKKYTLWGRLGGSDG